MPVLFTDVVIRGMHFRGELAQEYASALNPGDKLYLEREPDNDFDQLAIKVNSPEGGPGHIGYIGREFAAWLAPQMDEEEGEDYGPSSHFIAVVERTHTYKGNHYPVVRIEKIGAEEGIPS